MYEYKAICTRVYDGDTIYCDIDLGLQSWLKNQSMRLLNINTPEVRGPERPEGLKVRDWLADRIVGKEIIIRTHKARNKGKYGRWLVQVYHKGENLNETMLAKGMAEPY